MPERLPQIDATPYPWPFDGRWSPTDTALIVIDVQTDFCLPGGYCDQMGVDIEATGGVIAPIRRMLDTLRPRGFHVLHTREGHRSDLSDLNANKRWRSARAGAEIGVAGPCGRVLTRGEPGWEIAPEVAPLPGEPIIDKPGKGAFHATDLEKILRRSGVRNILFAGVTTDCCVHTTMRDANDRGYECLLLEDCCAATDPANHDAILRFTTMGNGLFGCVASSATVIQTLEAAMPAAVPA